ncbi:hypothetical protein [Kibdelosporangium phytohabitans]|uniref:DNA primase/polymerase bifunctional N-terminal domain-containing protein n=1 Tax=Kibdelosporangium phytohabitans TaxID=860235 RepID=A0A0N9I060_9PSEU|nr:hypothetical protein [Kibdelosporangium phytohabitans]ALG09051.1 hypothetical protein AOZ06_20925 [Kibdelosporangium phytohabitans]MBE1469762.1 hypothetical protein [Kibdelosporangium phytohabitans]
MADAAKLELLRALAGARTGYEERFGWPVTIEVRRGRLVMRLGDAAGALVLPRRLGGAVLAELRIALLAGPVLADTTGQWWMFLTRPPCGAARHDDELRQLDVHPVPDGASVVVPCEFDGKIGCPWIERPRSLAQLPPWSAVVATARRLARIPARREPEQAGLRLPGGAGRPSATPQGTSACRVTRMPVVKRRIPENY